MGVRQKKLRGNREDEGNQGEKLGEKKLSEGKKQKWREKLGK